MFRKPATNKRKVLASSLRRKRQEDDENDDDKDVEGTSSSSTTNDLTKNATKSISDVMDVSKDNERISKNDKDADGTAYTTIAEIKKKRKLLTDLQYRRGTNAMSLLGGDESAKDTTTLRRKLLSRTKRGDNTDDNENNEGNNNETTIIKNDTTQDGIIQQKHKRAMEEYVENSLSNIFQQQPSTQIESNSGTPSEITKSGSMEQTIYHELATKVKELTGSDAMGTAGNNGIDPDESGGGGGGGGGLEEVILPLSNRYEMTKQSLMVTAAARAESRSSNRNYRNTSTQSSSAEALQATALPQRTYQKKGSGSSVPNRFAVPYTITNDTTTSTGTSTTTASTAVDDDRIGFDATRQRSQQQHQGYRSHNNNNNNSKSIGGQQQQQSGSQNNSNNHNNHQRASDNRVYQQFVARQKR